MAEELDTSVKAPVLPVDETESPEGVPTNGIDLEGSELPTEITESYVKRLRTEAAEARVKLQKLNEYEAALFDLVAEREASKVLRSASDFTVTDRASFLGEDGYPSTEKIAAAVAQLVEAKPYLARVAGDVGQGARPEPEPAVSLGGLLRAAAQ